MGLHFLVISSSALVTLGSLYVAKNSFEAEANEQWKNLTGQDGTGWNDASDAFRHAYVSARFAQYIGSDAVDLLGKSYEIVGNTRDYFSSNSVDPRDNAMDEYNNRIGAEFGEKYDDLLPDELAKEIKKKTENGELVIDFEKDPRVQTPNDLPKGSSSLPKFNRDWYDNGYQCVAPWAKDLLPNRSGKYHVVDPLALDLDGKGIQTTATAGFSGSLFDHNKDGIRTATGWVAGGDGLLVRDLNGNGIIDNGGELFGDNTILKDGTLAQHGYAALTELDENADGKVNALDSAFSSLRIWQDKNQDGISQVDELRTLSDLGIESLNTAYSDVNQDLGNGNRVAQLGSYTKTDGSTAEMGDLLLANDNLYSRFTDKIELSAEQFQAAKQKIAECIWRFSYFLIGWTVVKVSGSEFGCVV